MDRKEQDLRISSSNKLLDGVKPLGYAWLMTSTQLKTWRVQNGYSQSQLAEVLGVHSMTISKWERGEREIPSFLHLALECLGRRSMAGKTTREGGE
jgi:DNA-binding XRE family transcriptional regulator